MDMQLDTDKVIEEMISKNGMTGNDADMMRKCKMGVCKVEDVSDKCRKYIVNG